MARYYDTFGNLVDENGHDILDDDEELADLDEVRGILDDDFEGEEWELDEDDFDYSLEYEDDYYSESYMTGDSDLMNDL